MNILNKKLNILIFSLIILFIFFSAVFKIAQASSGTNFQIEIIPGPECFDGQDNDNDSLIDYPDDPGCDSKNDNDETNADSTSPPPSGGGGGGGGGGGTIISVTSVTFSGRAYPLSKVTVLKDGQVAITTIAGPDANFNISLAGLSSGNYIFSVYGEDDSLRQSTLFTFPIFITHGATTNISGIFIAPTIAVDKSEVKRGDNIAIFGQGAPNAEITIIVNSEEELIDKVKADKNGVYLYNFDTSPLAEEQHLVKSKSAYNGEVSSLSKAISFVVGGKNVSKTIQKPLKGDLNGDGRVNLVDFSIVAYWFERSINEDLLNKEAEELNNDGKIDLVDFSIMAFYWTG